MKELPDGHRALEPPDTISNSEVKRCIADGSVGSPHVRVGHYQALFFIQIFLYFFYLHCTIFYLLKFQFIFCKVIYNEILIYMDL